MNTKYKVLRIIFALLLAASLMCAGGRGKPYGADALERRVWPIWGAVLAAVNALCKLIGGLLKTFLIEPIHEIKETRHA
jgi:hypothetical protein